MRAGKVLGLAGARGRGVFWTEGQVRKSISGTGCGTGDGTGCGTGDGTGCGTGDGTGRWTSCCGGAGRGQAEASVQLVEMGDEQELGRAERKVWLGGEIRGSSLVIDA